MKNKITIFLVAIIILILITVVFYKITSINVVNNNNSIIDNVNVATDIVETSKISGPAIRVTPLIYDLGVVIYGDVVKHIFIIENIGDQPLEITRLSTSCGCTKAMMTEANKIIEPGSSAPMTVTFDPAVHKDDTDLGELSRTIYIETNDPQNPRSQVEITANVVKK